MKTIEYAHFLDKIMNIDFNTVPLSDAFAVKLEYLLLCSNLSLLNFSIAVNLNYSYLNDLLRGKKHITLNKIDCICKSLNISVTELLDFTPLITMQEEKCFIKFPSIKNIFINYY